MTTQSKAKWLRFLVLILYPFSVGMVSYRLAKPWPSINAH